MENKINKKAETYVSDFKNHICDIIKMSDIDSHKKTEIIASIYEYPRMEFNKEDFSKRKRVKNTIPSVNRCTAKRANGEQCTRRRKDDSEFCGTHCKSAPHGFMASKEPNPTTEIFTEEINGIYYWIDHNNNIYKTDDILRSIEKPSIIGKYKTNEDNEYGIDEFF